MAPEASRRIYLRLAAKLMGMLALGFLALVMLSGLLPDRAPTRPDLSIDISRISSDELRLNWAGRRIVVVRRDPAVVAHLPEIDDALADPESSRSEQPPNLTAGRSVTPEIFVAYDYDPDFGCPVEWVPATEAPPIKPWLGGFRAPCSGSLFDLAGRVYRGHRTVQNLRIPYQRIESGKIVLTE